MANTGPGGSLECDTFAAALMAYRNTPDRDTKLSPSQILFARKMSDTVPVRPSDLELRAEWVFTREARERALARRHQVRGAELAIGTRVLEALKPGQAVQVQNQVGPHRNKWDLSWQVVECLPFDSYLVKMDRSGRVCPS